MRTARRESSQIDLPSPLGARTKEKSLPSRRKKRRKNRGGEMTPMRHRRRQLRQPQPARSLVQARRDRQGPPRPPRPGRLRSARRPQVAPGCPTRGAFVLSNKAAQDAPALRADELRPRRIDGASWSQIRCLHGRSLRRCCERVAQPKTAARTAAPAAQSLLACALWRGCCAAMAWLWRGMAWHGAAWSGMERHIAPEPVSAHRPPFSVGLTTSAVRRSSRRPPGCFRCGERNMNPC